MTTKKGKQAEFEQMVSEFQKSALKSQGCIYYQFYKSITNPSSFLVYYRFKTTNDQDDHVVNLVKMYGLPTQGRTLPKKFTELLLEEEVILFEDKK